MDTDAVRIPLATDLKTSISDTTKDARLINAHTETRGGVTRVKKRPGALATGWDFTTPIQGLFGGPLLYLIYGDEFEIVDVDNPPPPPPAAVEIGDLVGGYYAMIENPPTEPGPGDAYWSATPPGASRYVAVLAPGFGVDMSLSPLSVGPWRDLMRGAIAASNAATIKSFEDTLTAAGGVVCWFSSDGVPPNGAGATYRYLPVGCYQSGAAIETSDSRFSYATVNWTAGYVPSAIPAVGALLGFDIMGGVGALWPQLTKTPVVIESTGSVARIYRTQLHASKFPPCRRIEVSGANEPEYNGVFDVYLHADPLASVGALTGNLYYDMSGTPAASPATGTITVKYF